MRIIMIILYLLLILLGISFAALNAASVQVNFYVTTLTLPISVLMALTLGIGLIIGFLLFLSRYWRLKMACLKIRNQLKITEKEIKNLRTMPLKDQP
ncbi:Predicted membrane protein [Legionella beliardensis]|uniref:Predicted membrane protein n=1 Tax=Legionella beliardensis TaxID=91822 RepID=A0A378I2M1_9GAMM|nr:LapA family protein [Legionella beliardensis]STX28945.1 Predicted membrane protein [Legionella beliardensis]